MSKKYFMLTLLSLLGCAVLVTGAFTALPVISAAVTAGEPCYTDTGGLPFETLQTMQGARFDVSGMHAVEWSAEEAEIWFDEFKATLQDAVGVTITQEQYDEYIEKMSALRDDVQSGIPRYYYKDVQNTNGKITVAR